VAYIEQAFAGCKPMLQADLAQHRGNRCHNNSLAWNSSRYKIAHKFNRRTNLVGRPR
jgi:hypothetical protein